MYAPEPPGPVRLASGVTSVYGENTDRIFILETVIKDRGAEIMRSDATHKKMCFYFAFKYYVFRATGTETDFQWLIDSACTESRSKCIDQGVSL